jgi:integrase
MAVRKLPTGKYEIRYPSHRNPKGRISYRFKVVGYSKRKAKELEQKLYSDFKEREVRGIAHQSEKRKEYGVSDLLDWFLELDELKALKSYGDVVGRTRSPQRFFQDKKASELLPSDIVSYQYWRKEQKARRNKSVCRYNVSNASVNRELAILKQCFNLAIREQLLDKNPCSGVKPLKEKARNRICTREEFEALKVELHTDAKDIVTIAYYTGMRFAEIVGLEWNRVDFKNRLIFLRGEDTKNGEPRKVPFLSKEVDEVLQRRGGDPRRIHGRVFRVKSIRNAFERVCKKLAIKDLRFHDFRHTAATNLRKAGVDTATIMKICGWKSVAMFLHYNEVDDSDLQKASVAIAQVEGKLLTSEVVSG